MKLSWTREQWHVIVWNAWERSLKYSSGCMEKPSYVAYIWHRLITQWELILLIKYSHRVLNSFLILFHRVLNLLNRLKNDDICQTHNYNDNKSIIWGNLQNSLGIEDMEWVRYSCFQQWTNLSFCYICIDTTKKLIIFQIRD